MAQPEVFDSYNAGYAQALYEQYLRDPASVDEGWRRVFGANGAAAAGLIEVRAEEARPPAPTMAQLRAAMAAAELVDAYRLNGHFAARLDPLGGEPRDHPMLDPRFHGIDEDDLASVPASLLGIGLEGGTLADVLDWLKETYTGTIGYEYEHLEDPERRDWLRDSIESGRYRAPLEAGEKRRLLERLSEVEAMEQFLHRAYLGHKRFSIEGTDMLVPMLDLAIDRAAENGTLEAVIGMAHRGRLNVLAHVLGRPYAAILAEFEGKQAGTGTGDVKYHLGAEGVYTPPSGEPLTVTLAPNPSHLEFVNPVVQGIARAKQRHREGREIRFAELEILPILIHGDAAFSAQGVVAETLNISQLDGYRNGGTLHVIVNNQIGFTTEPSEARSTHYASDLARGFGVPIFHVNSDDPEACLAVVRLALAYRTRFRGDVVIDLVGYRRYGHNEGDEPAYTQPVMYRTIQDHPSVRKHLARALVEQGTLAEDDVEAAWDAAYQRLVAAQEEVRDAGSNPGSAAAGPAAAAEEPAETVVTRADADLLLSIDRQLHSWPADFRPHPKLAKALGRRSKALADGGGIDWAHAEALAFGSILAAGSPIRMTGQDTIRGTFSQRHLELRDFESGAGWMPLANLKEARAPIEVYNSPLSEIAILGFEYGYSVAVRRTLVIWEAQFGDFANAAQVVIDQFISGGRVKWNQASALTLLLPHGYEGQGPEHSSARLERFLQLAAEDNLRVANCSTPAQYFHLLRRQALLEPRHPLVVMTPKSLLRHPRAVSTLDALAGADFQPVLRDDEAADRADAIERLVLCSGKIYYDLTGDDAREAAKHIAIARVEELYPFPVDDLRRLLGEFPKLTEVVWVQEEPRNMGAWTYMEPRLRDLLGGEVPVRYVGRPERASPAEGYAATHEVEQKRIVREALAAASAKGRARSRGRGKAAAGTRRNGG